MQNDISKSKIGYRPTWAEINLSNLEFNFRQVKKIVGPKTRIMAVVKCDAYGHGLVAVAKRLAEAGTDFLAVASIEEAVLLREKGIKLPILILGTILKRDIQPILEYSLIQTIADRHLALSLNREAKKKGRIVSVHIKVDTGMGRLGILYKQALDFIIKISKLSYLKIEGLFTHFPCADCDPEFTRYQIEILNQLVGNLKKRGVSIPLVHAANSMGVIGYPESHFNLVRPGLMLYGIYPKLGLNLKLKPVLALKTCIIHLKRLPKAQGVSYGRTYITKNETTIAVLPIGYGDGYPRNLSNKADVLIKGRRFKISGIICMDYIMVDVGDLPVKLGDEVVLIGSQDNLQISAEELASLSQTIPYEIVCGIGSRVPRLYL